MSTTLPLLRRALTAASRTAATVLGDSEKSLVALETFCDTLPQPAALRDTPTRMRRTSAPSRRRGRTRRCGAFLNSCDGRWVRTTRRLWLQLSKEEAPLRIPHYLRLPLSSHARPGQARHAHRQVRRRAAVRQAGQGRQRVQHAPQLAVPHGQLVRLPGTHPPQAGGRQGAVAGTEAHHAGSHGRRPCSLTSSRRLPAPDKYSSWTSAGFQLDFSWTAVGAGAR